jgi:ABC-type dipeptide/oligopeptide/nickel transport system ATPase component
MDLTKNNETILRCRGSGLSSPQRTTAVDGVDFEVMREKFWTCGRVGWGRATALSILRLVFPPGKIIDGGLNFWHGSSYIELWEIRKIRGKRISMIFQDPLTS